MSLRGSSWQAWTWWVGFAFILILSSGCGYQFKVEGSGPVIGGGRAVEGVPVRLALHTLKNNTFEPNLEFIYTDYLRQALESSGSATIVEEDLSADFVLNGAVVSVSLPSLAFSQTQTQESRVKVKVRVKVKHRKTGEVRWAQTNTNSADFFVGASSSGSAGGSGLQFNRVLQDRALEQAGQAVAEDLADQFLSAREQGKFSVELAEPSSNLESGSRADPSQSPTYNAPPFFSPTTSTE